MNNNLSFITNEDEQNLINRFATLIKDTRYFDCLVGYFYASGFHGLYKSLEKTEKIRVLVGISTNKTTYDLISQSRDDTQLTIPHSSKEAKDEVSKEIIMEMENSVDSFNVEEGIRKFIDWLKSKKLEIRAYPAEKIHSKLYIMTFKEGDRDVGRVITGSSNFTQAGLKNNLEFNVELPRPEDYKFALDKFNAMWNNSVDVSEEYVKTIRENTWVNDNITPYELYLKFLYEYLKDKMNLDKEELSKGYLPDNFMDLKYQKDAVMDAKLKLEEYGGVFISDVVGLGKTFIATMLVKELDGRTLVIAPPILLDKHNPGSWINVFDEFGIPQRDFVSIGKLDEVIMRGTERFKNVVIDEAHRFRTEETQLHEKLRRICRKKRVILVSATPLNNTPKDILNQIKLFQNAHKSTLPNPKVKDLEKYFKGLQNKLKGLDRQHDKETYLQIVKENAEDIRNNILQHLMVRRTRNNIAKYYKYDLEKQNLKFPEVEDPEPVYYEFDKELDRIFTKTLELIINKFTYSRYTPLLYLKEGISQPEELSQKNMGKFMKILLLKRLESSFFAFKQSVDRFTYSYSKFIEEFNKGNVYVSKKYINKIFELLEDEDDEAIHKLVSEEKAERFSSKDFKPELIKYLESDLAILKEIKEMWDTVNHDPKLDKFIEILLKDKNLVKNKLIVFTESKETASYLESKLNPKFENKVLAFSSLSSEATRDRVINNFDPNVKHKAEDIKILVSTEILSEGVNLNRSNVVVNYDIPWNPVRMMQRVGRINRVGKNLLFDTIYTYNFFPAGPVDNEIKLKDAAEAKVKAFIEMLGNDARLLTDEEIKSHDLFRRINSKEIITGEGEEDDPELRYLTFLREIRDTNPALFEKVKRLPKKARTVRFSSNIGLLTFFRKGKLRKVYLNNGKDVEEMDFFKAAELLSAEKNDKPEKTDANYYKLLEENKKAFENVFIKEENLVFTGSRGHEAKLTKLIKALLNKAKELTDDDERYLQDVLDLLKDGSLPKPTIKNVLKNAAKESNPLRLLAVIKSGVHAEFFEDTFVSGANIAGPKEVILSEYFLVHDGQTTSR